MLTDGWGYAGVGTKVMRNKAAVTRTAMMAGGECNSGAGTTNSGGRGTEAGTIRLARR